MRAGQIGGGCEITLVIGVRRRIEYGVARVQALLHFRHFFRLDAEVLCDGLGFRSRQPGQAFFLLAKVEEQFALRLGRRDFYDAPVLEHELVNFGTNPVHRERYETNAVIGIKTLDGFHETDVAFLNQVVQWQAVACVAFGDMYNKTQMRHDQVAGGIEIFSLEKPSGQCLLVFLGENRNNADSLDIGVKAAYRSC